MSGNRFPQVLRDRIDRLRGEMLFRSLSLRKGKDFSSNDYLGFAEDAELQSVFQESLKDLPLGSSGSRLLRGHLTLFEQVEKKLAEFCGRESALVFHSGFQANLGLLSSLLTPKDFVFSDELNHASLIDGIRLSGAKKKIYSHRNTEHLESLLKESRDPNSVCVIVTESVFSMDGDLAPLNVLCKLAEQYEALLVVDEAHATGMWGDFEQNLGGGLVQALGLSDRVFATIHPAGKAMGVGGAWICGDQELKEFLINLSRPFIFSTAPIPALAVGLGCSVDYWKKVGKSRSFILRENSQFLRTRLREKTSLQVSPGESPIIPLILGENRLALQGAEFLQASGFDIRAIRPPTVPLGTARLRVTVGSRQSRSDLDLLVNQVQKFLEFTEVEV